MTNQEYERFVQETWIGNSRAENQELSDLFICTVGLGGETGEVLEKIKKLVRDGTPPVGLREELGDVLYYVTTIGRTFGISLTDIMQGNKDKLEARLRKGTLRGSGDTR